MRENNLPQLGRGFATIKGPVAKWSWLNSSRNFHVQTTIVRQKRDQLERFGKPALDLTKQGKRSSLTEWWGDRWKFREV
jgi:hypothetical protein